MGAGDEEAGVRQTTASMGNGSRQRQQRQGKTAADLLDPPEESGEEMGGWETLQPSTRA